MFLIAILLIIVVSLFIAPLFKCGSEKDTTYRQRLLGMFKLNSGVGPLFLTITVLYIAFTVTVLYVNRSEWDKPCHISYENCELASGEECRKVIWHKDSADQRTFYLDNGHTTIITISDSCDNRFVVSGATSEFDNQWILNVGLIDNEQDTLFIRESLVKYLDEDIRAKAVKQ